MSHTFDSVLDDELITILERNDSYGYYLIKIGELEESISIELGRMVDRNDTKFWVSHSIHTPLQMGPYRTSKPYDDSPAYALHRAIRGLTEYYREAVKQGHVPNSSWLVRNTS